MSTSAGMPHGFFRSAFEGSYPYHIAFGDDENPLLQSLYVTPLDFEMYKRQAK